MAKWYDFLLLLKTGEIWRASTLAEKCAKKAWRALPLLSACSAIL